MSRRLLAALGGVAAASTPMLAGAEVARPNLTACRTIAVATRAAYPHVSSIQAAVDGARPCDWILIAPGDYRGAVTIRTPDLHLRGLDRNRVVIDGAHRIGTGITIEADKVTIENLTVRNFDRASINDDHTGNEVLWRNVDGWWGRYLTAYDDGLRGGYGVWAGRSRDGELAHVYASGFSDSGVYIGACRDCRAFVEHVTAERNLIGLAATNASGHFIVEDSVFRANTVGLSLNSSESDPPAPQLGSCTAGLNRSQSPTITTTSFARCTIVRDNEIIDNNALTVPSETASVRPGSGIGIELLGSYGDLISGNLLAGNTNIAVLGLQLPERGTARFALAGNRISGNRIRGSRLAIAFAAGDTSIDNCLQGQSGGLTVPASLKAFACSRPSTPAPPASATERVLTLVGRLHDELVGHAHRGQPPPQPQPSMPDPCRGVPRTPLCHR